MEGSTTSNIGGLVGYNYGGKVEFSFVKSSTSITYTSTGAGSNIGGLIGCIYGCDIKGCSANINIDTSNPDVVLKIAGLIGDAFTKYDATAAIQGCYAVGNLTFNTRQTYGGFTGSLGGAGAKNLKNCYTSIEFNPKTDNAFTSSTIQAVTAIDCYFIKGTQSTTIENVVSSTVSELTNKLETFNNLGWENYQFVAGTDTEPLIITRK